MGLLDLFRLRNEENFDNYWNSEGHKAIFVLVYIVINVFLFFFWLGWFVPLVGTDGISGWVPLAKGFGMLLNFNCALILVPVLRNFLSWVRGTRVNDIVPIDKAIVFHRRIGGMIIFAAIGHAIAHLCNYGVTDTYWKFFGTKAGVTGFCLSIILIVLAIGAMERVRRSRFEVFFGIHHLFIPFFVLNLIHGPIFFWFFMVPGAAYTVERIVRAWRGSRPTILLQTVTLASRVISLQMSKTFDYKPGQYLYLNCPYLSRNEWHPFTITSSPDEDMLTVHIRIVGDWTGALANLLNPGGKQKTLLMNKATGPDGTPLLRVDGPFGAASEEAFNYEIAVLVGAGIGVTPFASILKSLRYRYMTGSDRGALRKVYFFWINRDKREFEWFHELMAEIEQSGIREFVELNAYLTGALSLEQIRTLVDQETGSHGVAQVRSDTITGLDSRTHFGRPQFNKIFEQMAQVHAGSEIGVFFCGPRPLSKRLYELCRESSGINNTTFVFNKENF
eukprot:TRINITY_DN15118_c0_g1_i1.p1 TRINITY_DN15118_c0_g1~~TRINITY_DN15118_c0_g1_i1.p1  ORF type:complete len:504 (-),score=79.14 TRINITY_DN15118_c0_g1_i1:41-1552(-)